MKEDADFDESVDYHEFAEEEAEAFLISDEEEVGVAGNEAVEDGAEEEEEIEEVASKRKLTSTVWAEFKRVKIAGEWKAKCIHCNKPLGGDPRNGTKHLRYHLVICVLKKIKSNGKTLSQPSLRFSSTS